MHMIYEPTEWAKGDVVTAAKLNNLEGGVAGARDVAYVTVEIDPTTGEYTVDKTPAEVGAIIDRGGRAWSDLYYSAPEGENPSYVGGQFMAPAHGSEEYFGQGVYALAAPAPIIGANNTLTFFQLAVYMGESGEYYKPVVKTVSAT